MATVAEKIAEIQAELHVEMVKIKDKLPWWKQTIIWVGVGIATGFMLVSCGLITVATFGAGVLPCIAAAIGLIVALLAVISHLVSNTTEANAMDVKLAKLEALQAVTSPAGSESESG